LDKKYFLNFVEEFWKGQIVKTMGRVEVYTKSRKYAIEEMRWGTNRVEEFLDFREKWDFKEVNKKTLDKIRERLKNEFLIIK